MANQLIGIMAVLGGGALLLTQAAKRDEQTKPAAKRKGSSGKATSTRGKRAKGSKAKGAKAKGSKKRAPSPYNRFVGQRLPQLKAQGYSPAKAMKVAASEWRVKQGR